MEVGGSINLASRCPRRVLGSTFAAARRAAVIISGSSGSSSNRNSGGPQILCNNANAELQKLPKFRNKR
jgi:hypothetical protein